MFGLGNHFSESCPADRYSALSLSALSPPWIWDTPAYRSRQPGTDWFPMPAKSKQLRVAVARSGHAARGGDPGKIETTRRDLAAERIASYVEAVVAEAPPFTAEQRARLALLLLTAGPGAAA